MQASKSRTCKGCLQQIHTPLCLRPLLYRRCRYKKTGRSLCSTNMSRGSSEDGPLYSTTPSLLIALRKHVMPTGIVLDPCCPLLRHDQSDLVGRPVLRGEARTWSGRSYDDGGRWNCKHDKTPTPALQDRRGSSTHCFRDSVQV